MALVYSCCFWFSLRLGGIMIGVFSAFQALLLLIMLSLMYTRVEEVQDATGNWINNMNLLFTTEYIENFRADPEKYITFGMCSTCLYIIFCVMYVYGAYKCSNTLMVGYIVAELMRLLGLSVGLVVWLLVLKQNTMDIGLLIGASVASGFLLLGMFYLWVCAANLPVLINEMEREEQAATIAKLQQLLQANGKITTPFERDDSADYRYKAGIFTIPQSKMRHFSRPLLAEPTLRYGRWN